jgi:hypothetical protein
MPLQEIDLFDPIAWQVQELTLADEDNLQMGLEQREFERDNECQPTWATRCCASARQRSWTASEALRQLPLSFTEPRQQHDLAIGELERVIINVKHAL